jgi:hypothetical protein
MNESNCINQLSSNLKNYYMYVLKLKCIREITSDALFTLSFIELITF